jgi:hypothetical protein
MKTTIINGLKIVGWVAADKTYISAIPEAEEDALMVASVLEKMGFDVKITPHTFSDGVVGFYNVDAVAEVESDRDILMTMDRR